MAVPCGAQGAGQELRPHRHLVRRQQPGVPVPVLLYAGGRWPLLPRQAQNGYDVRPIPPGYVAATAWVGETAKSGGRTFDSYLMSYWLWDPAAAAEAGLDRSLPEVDIVHSRIRFIDCDTFTATIDVFGAYFAFTPDKTPFVTPPDADYLFGGPPIVETYHRMPTSLRHMTAPSTPPRPAVAAAGASAAPTSKSLAPPVAADPRSKKRR